MRPWIPFLGRDGPSEVIEQVSLFLNVLMDLLSFFFLHERLDAEMQGFQNLDESAINQLGSFRFSLQVAALELSETWSCYHWTGEDRSHTLRLSHTMLSGAMQKYDREHSMCGGLETVPCNCESKLCL